MRSQSGTVRIHGYISDGVKDAAGHTRCMICLLPRSNRAHGLPERTDEQRADEARRTGDRH